MEYKYEPVFGDQSLFDGAPEDAEAVGGGKPHQDALVFYKFSDGEFQYKYEAEKDDWKVSTCKHPQSVIKAMRRIIAEPKRWTVADHTPISLVLPIETPEEKAARLRNKWCNRAMDYSTIQQLYDAMLSGDLPVPVKE